MKVTVEAKEVVPYVGLNIRRCSRIGGRHLEAGIIGVGGGRGRSGRRLALARA